MEITVIRILARKNPSPAFSPSPVSPLRFIFYQVMVVPSFQIVYVILARKHVFRKNKTGRISLQL